MMASDRIFKAVLDSLVSFPDRLKLMLLAGSEADKYRAMADEAGIELLFEAFADRRYLDNGHLTPRSEPDAVLDSEQVLAQVKLLAKEGVVITRSGNRLVLNPDTLCVHGDNPHAIAMVKQIRDLLPR